jgi:hypothetical protein
MKDMDHAFPRRAEHQTGSSVLIWNPWHFAFALQTACAQLKQRHISGDSLDRPGAVKTNLVARCAVMRKLGNVRLRVQRRDVS